MSPTPSCYRVSNIPSDWRYNDLLHFLSAVDGNGYFSDLRTHGSHISLYPSCSSGAGQTALLNLYNCPEALQRQLVDGTIESDKAGIVIDDKFYGLTPLNEVQRDHHIVVDIIAVAGLAGHAFGSWRNKESHRMWLQDFLPYDVKNARIMTYGCRVSHADHDLTGGRMLDHRRHLIQQIKNARSSEEERKRPIVFVAHSLGGILVAQVLLHSKILSVHKEVLDATRAVLFFGVPHQGMRNSELEAMVADLSRETGHETGKLRKQLREESEYLELQREELVEIWNTIKTVSFYETLETPTMKKSFDTDVYEHNGEMAGMVKTSSAQLYSPSEIRVPVVSNNTDIVKYQTAADETYGTVVHHIQDCLRELEHGAGNENKPPEKKAAEQIADAEAIQKSIVQDAFLGHRLLISLRKTLWKVLQNDPWMGVEEDFIPNQPENEFNWLGGTYLFFYPLGTRISNVLIVLDWKAHGNPLAPSIRWHVVALESLYYPGTHNGRLEFAKLEKSKSIIDLRYHAYWESPILSTCVMEDGRLSSEGPLEEGLVWTVLTDIMKSLAHYIAFGPFKETGGFAPPPFRFHTFGSQVMRYSTECEQFARVASFFSRTYTLEIPDEDNCFGEEINPGCAETSCVAIEELLQFYNPDLLQDPKWNFRESFKKVKSQREWAIEERVWADKLKEVCGFTYLRFSTKNIPGVEYMPERTEQPEPEPIRNPKSENGRAEGC